MPATISRLLMCFGVLIGSFAIYISIWLYIEQNHRDIWAFRWAGLITSALFASAWVLIWHGAVQWSSRRIARTFILIPLCVLPAWIMSGVVIGFARHADEIGWFIAYLVWITAWIIGTALIWQENAKERGERLRRLGIHAVACPDCGYNLTGLKEAKCPECGAVYTLDQLYASIAEQRAELGGE